MSIISSADTGAADLPEIANSLRFDGTNDYLSRTFGTPTDNTICTLLMLVKRGNVTATQTIFSSYASTGNYVSFEFRPNGELGLYYRISGIDYSAITNGAFRDPSAHIHVVMRVDSNNATLDNRLQIYVNNEKQTFSTNTIPQTTVSVLNRNYLHTLGNWGGGTQYFDGYLSHVCFLDGQLKLPTDFAYTDPNGQWRSLSGTALKALADAGGTNSFFLDFSNSAALGEDVSSKGNDWTLNNFPAASQCQMTDTPTNNFATLNPIDSGSAAAVKNGALDFYGIGNALSRCSIQVPSTGLWYAEFKSDVSTNGNYGMSFGVSKNSDLANGYNASNLYVLYSSAGGSLIANGSVVATVASIVSTETYRIAVEGATGKVWLGRNATWLDSTGGSTGNPATLTNPTFIVSGELSLCVGLWCIANSTWSANFGQRAFAYTPPTGFKALCTKNLPVPTGAAAEPKKHFAALSYLGTGTTKKLTTNFPVDLLWAKSRAVANSHGVVDRVRGAGSELASDRTDAEATGKNGVTSFDPDGVTLGASTYFDINLANNHVAWLWKAGGAAVTNTAGSISSQVSANPAAGFSIVTYTGTGANATVGHGLGVAPKLIILKPRNAADNWPVWHGSFAVNEYVYLNNTNAKASLAAFQNSVMPSSTAFSLGTWANTNTSAQPMVAYCFAEVTGYSKIGSYIGNGSADGPFVYCGFKPRWLMIKRADSAASWTIWDSTRSTYNQMQDYLLPNSANAEANNSTVSVDVTANGFKVRGTDSICNTSGGTYIFIAIAEQPFQWSNAK